MLGILDKPKDYAACTSGDVIKVLFFTMHILLPIIAIRTHMRKAVFVLDADHQLNMILCLSKHVE